MIPGVAIACLCRAVGDALLGHDLFQRRKPVPVIGLAGVGIARFLRALDLLCERRRPFVPREQSAFMQGERHREGMRLPRLAEDRAIGVRRDAGNGSGRAPRLVGIERSHAGSRYGSQASTDTFTLGIRIGAPQLAALEAHGVKPLRIFAGAGRMAVGKDVTAAHMLDDADMSAHIARQPRVCRRVHGLRAHAIAGRKPRRRRAARAMSDRRDTEPCRRRPPTRCA